MNSDDKNIPFPSLGERIKYLREEFLRLTQEELAHKLGFKSKVTVSNWEKNINEPEVHILLTLAKEANVSLYWLVANEGSIKIDLNVAEPKTNYGIKKDEIELLINNWDRPEIKDKLLELLYQKIENKKLLSEIDKGRKK